ncbi:MAG: DUF835 domain-containing protein [Methanomassiliicoccales archaeon]|nr:MAG: DUF835 domain-containing protein [Methanomassiliicoccales archaeon]
MRRTTADAFSFTPSRIANVTLPLAKGNVTLDYGMTYIIPNESMEMSLEIISKLTLMTDDIICLSRMHPSHIAERWPSAKIRSYWLTQRAGEGNVSPDQPSAVKGVLESFMRKKGGAVAILDGFEHLSVYNNFHILNVMFEELNDVVMETRSILLVPLDPRSLDEMSLARLRRFAEIVL